MELDGKTNRDLKKEEQIYWEKDNSIYFGIKKTFRFSF